MTASTSSESVAGCQVCESAALIEAPGFSRLSRVTSDCRPFRSGGRLWVCDSCGAIQKVADQRFKAEAAEIYSAYDIYHQSSGVEQAVFDGTTGKPTVRTVALLERLAKAHDLSTGGRLLDFGCGNGAMLTAFSGLHPGWSLFGLDLDERHLARLRKLAGFAGLHTGPVEDAPGPFDLITLMHSLEHVEQPVSLLRSLARKLAPTGRLFIQVPNSERNPFDLVIADHIQHFYPTTLAYLVGRAGLAVERLETDWVSKEISLLARRAAPADSGEPSPCRPAIGSARRAFEWLAAVEAEFLALARKGKTGLFGSSISATWLFGMVPDSVALFVDEDPARAGGSHMGRQILPPASAPRDLPIYLALVPALAERVKTRLAHLALDLRTPPDLALEGGGEN